MHFHNVLEKHLSLDLARTEFKYSTTNIPVQKDLYFKTLISKSETLVKNMRWRALFHLNPNLRMEHKETYGFISSKPPPILQELKEFENELADFIQNIKFKDILNHFKLNYKKFYRKSRKTTTSTSQLTKTNNYYRVKPAHYELLLEGSIHKSYRRMDRATIAETTRTDVKFCKKN